MENIVKLISVLRLQQLYRKCYEFNYLISHYVATDILNSIPHDNKKNDILSSQYLQQKYHLGEIQSKITLDWVIASNSNKLRQRIFYVASILAINSNRAIMINGKSFRALRSHKKIFQDIKKYRSTILTDYTIHSNLLLESDFFNLLENYMQKIYFSNSIIEIQKRIDLCFIGRKIDEKLQNELQPIADNIKHFIYEACLIVIPQTIKVLEKIHIENE